MSNPKITTFRGSRKHVLDWTERSTFLTELVDLLNPVPVQFDSNTAHMPRGYAAPDEARLDRLASDWIENPEVRATLRTWWLKHSGGANTPNWDIAVACRLEDRQGLILVEAKAHWVELDVAGKPIAPDASSNSRENHEHIRLAIEEANQGWKMIDSGVSIGRDSHYQLANRLAFAWKLASLGMPVGLVYLGFTGDQGIRDVGAPFVDGADWHRAFATYTSSSAPMGLFNRRLSVNGTPVWLLSRHLAVLESSSLVQ